MFMVNMANMVNFFKWQILARLPKGSIFERVRASILSSNINDINPLYYVYWLDIEKSLFEKYLLGTFGTTNADYTNFITWLDSNYRHGDFYEIKIDDTKIILPRPSFEDYKCFKAEFLDIIMPSLTKETATSLPYLEGPYEYKSVSLNKGDTVLDCGANYGLFSSLASAKGCKVFAFEPTTEVVTRYLSHLSAVDKNIEVIKKAVSNVTGNSSFKINPNHSSCNSLEIEPHVDDPYYTTVETTSVDDFVSQHNLSNVDFIKADIEGAERLMLEGARQTLKEYAPKLAICFYHCLDDLKVLTKLIKEANPDYKIDVAYKKLYAYVPRKSKSNNEK